MSQGGVTAASRNLKKLLDDPKIIFVLGGPASGKGTQCAKIVQEFGFSHISTGDLMRAEAAKGSRLGEQIKKIQKEGKLVPFEVTVEVLVNGLIATPSKTKTYLIDGFPRSLDQANYFEKHVVEAHQVLFFDVSKEKMLERCLKRAETSGRADDNEVALQKRVDTYFAQTLPVIEYYKQFGKVHQIDATGSIDDVYAQTKTAILPQCMFLMGPKASGKTTVGADLVRRANVKLLDFNHFLAENALESQDDETKTGNFIQHLAKERATRLVLENFPENLAQAAYFVKNGTAPSHVFNLTCSKDSCQERMMKLGETHPRYVPSALLAQRIRKFNTESEALLPFFQASTNLIEIDSDQPLDKTLEAIYNEIEPLVIHVRPLVKFTELRNEIIHSLCNEHGFVHLDIQRIQKGAENRGTQLGQVHAAIGRHTPELAVDMLKQAIYCGQPRINKFVISNYPEQEQDVKVFESNCCKIAAMIFPTADEAVVEIKGNASYFTIDSYFQKKLKLKTMKEWSYKTFEEKMDGKIQFGFMVGKSLAGKTTVAKFMEEKLGYQILDMKAEQEKIREAKGSDGAPFEGDIPVEEVEAAILSMVKSSPPSSKFIIDDYIQKSEDEFLAFVEKIGVPDFILFMTAKEDAIKARYMKKNETEELNEEQQAEIKADSDANKAKRQSIQKKAASYGDRCALITQSTDRSLETTKKQVKTKFSPGIIVVKHDPKLSVDASCSNLSLKYNMLYISAYQLIKEEIEQHTELGQRLVASKIVRELSATAKKDDAFQQEVYNPVHYPMTLVYELVNKRISEKRTTQKFVLLEGLLNSQLLASEDDKIEIREMDEFFALEHYVGAVTGIVSLQTEEEAIQVDPASIVYHQFPKPESVKEEKAKKPAGEGEEEEEEAQEAAPEEGAEEGDGKPQWNPEDYTWTVTNRKSKNLPQLFVGSRGANGVHEVRPASDFGTNRLFQIAECLDQFCNRCSGETEGKSYYQQVTFK